MSDNKNNNNTPPTEPENTKKSASSNNEKATPSQAKSRGRLFTHGSCGLEAVTKDPFDKPRPPGPG